MTNERNRFCNSILKIVFDFTIFGKMKRKTREMEIQLLFKTIYKRLEVETFYVTFGYSI